MIQFDTYIHAYIHDSLIAHLRIYTHTCACSHAEGCMCPPMHATTSWRSSSPQCLPHRQPSGCLSPGLRPLLQEPCNLDNPPPQSAMQGSSPHPKLDVGDPELRGFPPPAAVCIWSLPPTPPHHSLGYSDATGPHPTPCSLLRGRAVMSTTHRTSGPPAADPVHKGTCSPLPPPHTFGTLPHAGRARRTPTVLLFGRGRRRFGLPETGRLSAVTGQPPTAGGLAATFHRLAARGTLFRVEAGLQQRFASHAAASGGDLGRMRQPLAEGWVACGSLRRRLGSHAAASGRGLGRMRQPLAEGWVACGSLRRRLGSHAAASGRGLGRMRQPPAETWVACGSLRRRLGSHAAASRRVHTITASGGLRHGEGLALGGRWIAGVQSQLWPCFKAPNIRTPGAFSFLFFPAEERPTHTPFDSQGGAMQCAFRASADARVTARATEGTGPALWAQQTAHSPPPPPHAPLLSSGL